ncbi:MAG: TetR/AcrR family transcriptional regulator, partial [Congregibacter sp.]|nr:TetR/AcrR family transcriptional regulator [Congregibacter sp.]
MSNLPVPSIGKLHGKDVARNESDRSVGSTAVDNQRPPRSKAEQRRRKIFRSLHDCIIANGYSKTTLAHIAKGADMSPSHLLYYFQGKDRILEEYFADVATWFLKRVSDISQKEPDKQIHELTKLWFGEGDAAYDEIGFMLECFGEAVQD